MNGPRAWLPAVTLALAAVCLPAWAADPPPEGRNYTPGNFDAIEISRSAAVRFAQGASDQVFVEGDEGAQ